MVVSSNWLGHAPFTRAMVSSNLPITTKHKQKILCQKKSKSCKSYVTTRHFRIKNSGKRLSFPVQEEAEIVGVLFSLKA